jgi:hypothetical protein
MPYFSQHDLLFLHIPKTGGTVVERKLELGARWPAPDRQLLFGLLRLGPDHFLTLQHATLRELLRFGLFDRQRLDGTRSFTLVREPFARCASLYRWWGGNRLWNGFSNFVTFLEHLNMDDYDHNGMHTARPEFDYLNMNDMPAEIEHHFLPQYQFVCDESGAVAVDEICRFEDLPDALYRPLAAWGIEAPAEMFNINRAQHHQGSEHTLYDHDTVQRVARLYERDFAMFNYDSELLRDISGSVAS